MLDIIISFLPWILYLISLFKVKFVFSILLTKVVNLLNIGLFISNSENSLSLFSLIKLNIISIGLVSK